MLEQSINVYIAYIQGYKCNISLKLMSANPFKIRQCNNTGNVCKTSFVVVLRPSLSGASGCVRLASPGRPRCMAGFFSRMNVANYLHTFVLGKKNATHWGRPGEANRTHLVWGFTRPIWTTFP